MQIKQTGSLRRNTQAGFTLIELVVVIVILGILAATALPKFADLGKDARIAKIKAGAGAVASAAATVHAQYLVDNSKVNTAPTSVTMDGVSIAVSTAGFPTTASILTAASISSTDYTAGTVSGSQVPITDVTKTSNCGFTYDSSTGAVSSITTSSC